MVAPPLDGSSTLGKVVEHTFAFQSEGRPGGEGCGYERDPTVGGDYQAPFAFNGTVVRAEVMATGPVVRDPEAEGAAILTLH